MGASRFISKATGYELDTDDRSPDIAGPDSFGIGAGGFPNSETGG